MIDPARNAPCDSSWERVRAASRPAIGTRPSTTFGARTDTGQNVRHTLAQAAGKEPVPPKGEPTLEEAERAYRFGYGARRRYGREFPAWDERVEALLEMDWRGIAPDDDWRRFRRAVRRGWEFDKP
jgi:hypothetical protein